MTGFKITNLKHVENIAPEKAWAQFDIEYADGRASRGVTLLDDGTRIHLNGIEATTDTRERIISAAMAEYIRRQQ